MKKLKLLLLSIFTVFLFSGCTAIGMTIGALGSVIFESTDLDLAKKEWLERFMFMNEKKHVLLSEDEKVRAAKNICALKHLDKRKNNQIFEKKAKVFCQLEKNDKIYFYDKCMECGYLIDTIGTSYLLVRDNKPIELVEIETRWSEKERRNIPIVERLH